MVQRISLEIGHKGDAGKQRDLNEDSYLVLTPPAVATEIDALLAVADGMGGHQAGDVASQTLVEALDQLFRSSEYQDYVAYSPTHPDYYIVVLKDVLEQINETICDLSVGRSELRGMGTTATVLLLAEGNIFWGHIGDSRAYVIRNGDMRQLTRDHTWVAEQVAAGSLDWEEATHHPRRHQLTQSIGTSLLVRVERGMQALNGDEVLFLCTDGLTNCVGAPEIQRVLVGAEDLQAACDQLVTLANQRGGPDNITVIAARPRKNGEGTQIAGGRVLGPEQRYPSPSGILPDTLRIKRKKRKIHIPEEVTFSIGLLALLLAESLCIAVLALFVPQVFGDSVTSSLVLESTIAAVAFLVGAFTGWVLRSIRSKIIKEEKDEK